MMACGDRLNFIGSAVQDDALARRRLTSFVGKKINRQARPVRTLGAAEAECRTKDETDEDAGNAPEPQALTGMMCHCVTQGID